MRHTRRDTVNGDQAEEAEDDEGGDDEGAPDAAFNTTRTRKTGWGLALSYARHRGAHQSQVGATADTARLSYKQLERAGFSTDDRGVTPGDEEAELSADVDGQSTSFGVYATDTVQLAPRTHLTATARYNRSRVSNPLTIRDDDSGVLEDKPRERFTYESVDPALGVAHRLFEGAASPTMFANVARNATVPTVIGLGCADPEEPCRLPAGLQADPYLKLDHRRVGLRWPIAPAAQFSIALYRTVNKDDILFRSVNVSGQLGYFDNFKRTRNQGVDAELAFTVGPVDVGIGYSFLDATCEADGVLRQGERNVPGGTRSTLAADRCTSRFRVPP